MPRKPQRSTSGGDAQGRSDARGLKLAGTIAVVAGATIPNVPESRYLLSVWYERSLPADLKSVSRVVTISDTAKSLEAIRVIENTNFTLEHKNKYGQDYVPPASTSPSYKNP